MVPLDTTISMIKIWKSYQWIKLSLYWWTCTIPCQSISAGIWYPMCLCLQHATVSTKPPTGSCLSLIYVSPWNAFSFEALLKIYHGKHIIIGPLKRKGPLDKLTFQLFYVLDRNKWDRFTALDHNDITDRANLKFS